MKAVLLSLAAGAALAGCAVDPYGNVYPYGSVSVQGTYPAHRDGAGYRGQRDRDRDRDGVPNRRNADRDGDGVPNRYDERPANPRRY